MSVTSLPEGTAAGADWHRALLYENPQQYCDGVLRFVDEALDERRPLFVAVPGARSQRLRAAMDGRAERVRFADMEQLGRNPARIISAIRAFADEFADTSVSFVGEPIWPGRSSGEVAEATRHEALINLAFKGARARVLCPYDVSGLPPDVIADAHRTHPRLVDGKGDDRASDRYTDPHRIWTDVIHLPAAPTRAEHFDATAADLPALRSWVRRLVAVHELSEPRGEGLLLTVTELVTNSVRHGGGAALVTIWAEHAAIVCEVRDRGTIDDPLVGRVLPPADARNGRGLWLVNQLCDLVQLHSSGGRTRVRIRI